jgi:hypothetical protein
MEPPRNRQTRAVLAELTRLRWWDGGDSRQPGRDVSAAFALVERFREEGGEARVEVCAADGRPPYGAHLWRGPWEGRGEGSTPERAIWRAAVALVASLARGRRSARGHSPPNRQAAP